MAHRTQYSKDIKLPQIIQQQRLGLQKQIKQIKQKQNVLVEQNEQKLRVLEKRAIYGKKKIFGAGQKWNKMTAWDEIGKCNGQIANLKMAIQKQQQDIRMRKQRQRSNLLVMSKVTDQILSLSPTKKKSTTTPHQQLMSLTHEIIRLKKSLQQVRSKYNDNFTQYKLREQHAKLSSQNQTITQQLKHIQRAKHLINEASVFNCEVDYDQIENSKAKKEYQIVKRQNDLLSEYLANLQDYEQEKQSSDQRKIDIYKLQKITKLKEDIFQCRKRNQILQHETGLTQNDIRKENQRHRLMTGRMPH